MPYINGKYYMNPQYGSGLERARRSGDVFDAIAKSLETGSARPILEAILRGAESSGQPVVPRGAGPSPRNGIEVSQFQAGQQHGDAQSSAQGQAHSHAHDSAIRTLRALGLSIWIK